jgi:capsular polysaccharide transport system permease protein
MLREMSTSYGRSPGGYIWAIAEPVAAIAFLSLVFSVAFGAPPIGVSFPMFYATGMVPFVMFNDLHNKVSQSLMYSKPLLAYPNVTFLDAILARFFLNLLTQLLVVYLVFTTTILVFEGRVSFDLWMIVDGLALAAFLGLGIGTLNAFIYMRVPVWQQAWSVLTRPLFILSCTLMLYDGIPQPYRDWLWWNPLVHVTGLVRGGFYASYDTYYVSMPYALIVAMGCFVLGLALLRRHHRDLFEKT